MAKVVCVLCDDAITGYPTSYARDDLPRIDHYPGGQTLPTPRAIDFQPGVMLGSVSGELGLRKYLSGLPPVHFRPIGWRDASRSTRTGPAAAEVRPESAHRLTKPARQWT